MKKRKMTVVDLFAGAGGMSEGFKQVGFDILAANEIESTFVETYKLNHRETKVFHGDITKISVKEFKEKCGLNEKKVDLVIGGPPCQGFSNANRQRGFIDDPRNSLYKHFVKMVKGLKPKYFIMENVRGMNKIANQIIEDFRKIGYASDYRLLNARNYGIPQNRERIFFIGTNQKNNFAENMFIINNIFKNIKEEETKDEENLINALWGLRKLEPQPEKNMTNNESKKHGLTEDVIIRTNSTIPEYILKINKGKIPKKIFNHKTRYNNERDIEIFKRLPPGGKSDHPSIKDIMPYKNRNHVFKDKFFKLLPNTPCKTITAHMRFDCHMYIHPNEARGLTPREAARIQSFPDNYKFAGPFTSWYTQIGNAVPPQLANILAKSIVNINS